MDGGGAGASGDAEGGAWGQGTSRGGGSWWSGDSSWGSWPSSSWASGTGSWGASAPAEAPAAQGDGSAAAVAATSNGSWNASGWQSGGGGWGAGGWGAGGWGGQSSWASTGASGWASASSRGGWAGSGGGEAWGAGGGTGASSWSSYAGGASARSRSAPSRPGPAPGTAVFVGDLSPETSVAGLNAHFASAGTVRYATLHKDKVTGQFKGSGKVIFDDEAAASRAIDELHGSWLDGRQITVRALGDAPPAQRRENDGRQVFVGGLGWGVDADSLRSFCELVGGVTYATVFRDRETGLSRGAGRVDFESSDLAQRALRELHGRELDGRLVTVELMGQESASRRPAAGGPRPPRANDGRQLYVGSLSPETDAAALRAFCEQAGTVTYCTVFVDRETGKQKGAGKVEFETVEQAQQGLEMLQGATLDGRAVTLELMGQERPRAPREEVDPACKLFIGGLASGTSEEQLRDLLTQAGEVKSVAVWVNHRGTAGKATMSSPEEAQRAISALHDTWLAGERIAVRLDGPPPERPKPQLEAMIFVGGLNWETTVDGLRAHFGSIGEIVHAAVFMDRETGRSRGSGKVEFASPELCQRAIEELNDSELDGRRLQVKRMEAQPPSGGEGGKGARPPPGLRPPRENDGRQVFFGGLNRATEAGALAHLCEERLGVSCAATIFRDRETGQPKGAAKVEFETVEDAQRAIKELDGAELDGHNIAVRLLGEERKPPQPDGRTVFVGGLSWDTNDEGFRNFFEQVGEVAYSSVFIDRETGKPKGSGKVQFRTPEEAQRAVDELNGMELDGREIAVRMMEASGGGKGKGKGKGKHKGGSEDEP